jgi:hypothetical protein
MSDTEEEDMSIYDFCTCDSEDYWDAVHCPAHGRD